MWEHLSANESGMRKATFAEAPQLFHSSPPPRMLFGLLAIAL